MWLLIEVDDMRDVGKNERDRIKVHYVNIDSAHIPPNRFFGRGTRVHPATRGG